MSSEAELVKQAICKGVLRGAEDIAADIMRDYASGDVALAELPAVLTDLQQHAEYLLTKVAEL